MWAILHHQEFEIIVNKNQSGCHHPKCIHHVDYSKLCKCPKDKRRLWFSHDFKHLELSQRDTPVRNGCIYCGEFIKYE